MTSTREFNKKTVTIIGSGLAGSLLSLYLGRQNYSVVVYEKRSDMRISEVERGRSINLAISRRGINALERLNIAEDIMKKAVPMHSRMIHDLENKCVSQSYGRNKNEYINAISRSDLNIDLLNQMDDMKNIKTYFDQEVTSVDIDSGDLTILNKINNTKYSVKTEVILATDGGPSIIRQKMIEKGISTFGTNFLPHGYKELTIDEKYSKQMDKNHLHIWPRKNFMLIALPNAEGSFTCTLFLPIKGNNCCFEKLKTRGKVQSFFEKYFPDIPLLIPNVTEQFLSNPVGELATLKGTPWYYKDKILLLGDAAHAIVPFFGQGMNCAFEDCVVFDNLLKRYKDNWQELFTSFFKSRKRNTDAIAQMAIDNMLEMSSHTADSNFILHKSVEKKLMERYGKKYISKYVLVSFTLESYKFAQECGLIQETFLKRICTGINSVKDINWSLVDQEFNIYLKKIEKKKNELL